MPSSDETPVGREAARRGEAGPRWFGELGLAEYEMEFSERIQARHPDYVVDLRALGDVLSYSAVWLVSFRTTVWPATIWPVTLARQAATREAIEELGRAIECGYADFGHLEIDPDLDSLRKLPAYRKLMRQYGIQS